MKRYAKNVVGTWYAVTMYETMAQQDSAFSGRYFEDRAILILNELALRGDITPARREELNVTNTNGYRLGFQRRRGRACRQHDQELASFSGRDEERYGAQLLDNDDIYITQKNQDGSTRSYRLRDPRQFVVTNTFSF